MSKQQTCVNFDIPLLQFVVLFSIEKSVSQRMSLKRSVVLPPFTLDKLRRMLHS